MSDGDDSSEPGAGSPPATRGGRMNPGMDDIDRRIIAILQTDGRRAYSQIAEDLGIPASSVRYRVQRLEESGVLQIVGIANPLTIGFNHLAMIGIRVRAGTVQDVCRDLTDLPETSYVIVTAGHYDVMAEVICRDTEHFTELLTRRMHTIDGVVSTDSFFALEVHKLAYGWGVPAVLTSMPGSEDAEGPRGLVDRRGPR